MKPSSVQVAGVGITHPDRVVYGDTGITKLELAQFYEAIASRVLPHVEGRPLSIIRCPTGLDAGALVHGIHQSGRGSRGDTQCFFQKHANSMTPRVIRRVLIRESTKTAEYLAIDDERGLITLIQFGALELHPWGARADRPDAPDRMVFDLDPGAGIGWELVVRAAHSVRERLTGAGLVSFVKTTGGKGLHVVVPLEQRYEWHEVTAFSRNVAESMEREEPETYVSRMALHLRPGKIFVDYLRNGRGATAVAAYSTRARPKAPVALPVSWEELDQIAPDAFTVRTLSNRLKKRDPWKDFFDTRQRLPSTPEDRKPRAAGKRASSRPRRAASRL